jgi:hypothetical protein
MNIDYRTLRRPRHFDSTFRDDILDAFGTWIKRHLKDGWNGYLFTFMFNQLPGTQERQRDQMHEEITTVYRKLVTRVVRKPHSPTKVDSLPRGVFFLDKTVPKKAKHGLRDVSVNDGLHMHGVFVSPKTSRLKVGLEVHFREEHALYKTPKLHRIHVEPIDHGPVYTTNYAGKALKTRRFTEDDVLILPQSVSELAQQRSSISAEARKLRDIQSRYGFSDEVALAMLAKKRFVK